MKVKEILELTQTDNVATIARERLTIGEKKLREALKATGATNISGKKGWFYEGDPAVLEQSIYDFAAPSKPAATSKKTSQKVNNKTKQEPNKTERKSDIMIPESKPTSNKTKKVTYEIEEQLHDEIKIKSIREKRTVSEIVNELIKRGLE
jgi:hypothetical protein